MSRIHGRDTRPEMIIRKGLHATGLRFRVHERKLPGTPDLAFAKFRTAVFVHGCFWHGHECQLGVKPKTNADFWLRKIDRNKARDCLAVTELVAKNWRVAIVWECAIRGRHKTPIENVIAELSEFIRDESGNKSQLDISGRNKQLDIVQC